jgi:hypothetical protein
MSPRPIFLKRHRVPVLLRDYWAVVLLALLLGLSVAWLEGCSTLAKPQTINQRIAYVDEAGLTSSYQTIGELKVSGRIDAAKRDDLVGSADAVGSAVDAARTALASGDISTAEGKLRLARDGLMALQKILEETGR